MLFNLECCALLLHADAQIYVQILGLGCGSLIVLAALVELGIICVLYVSALILLVEVCINAVLYKIGIQLIHEPVLTGKVNHGTGLHLAVDHEE